MAIWKNDFSLEAINHFSANTLVSHLGIVYTEIGEDYLVATMPVDDRTVQPMRLLHGGASVALAESLGSSASMLCLQDVQRQYIVGVEINANHLQSARSGLVKGVCKPVRVGRTLHVWNIEIFDENNTLLCVSRLTVAVIDRK